MTLTTAEPRYCDQRGCDTRFVPSHPWRRFCSEACRLKERHARDREQRQMVQPERVCGLTGCEQSIDRKHATARFCSREHWQMHIAGDSLPAELARRKEWTAETTRLRQRVAERERTRLVKVRVLVCLLCSRPARTPEGFVNMGPDRRCLSCGSRGWAPDAEPIVLELPAVAA